MGNLGGTFESGRVECTLGLEEAAERVPGVRLGEKKGAFHGGTSRLKRFSACSWLTHHRFCLDWGNIVPYLATQVEPFLSKAAFQ